MSQDAGYAVGWGALALINAGLAQGKGRSGLTPGDRSAGRRTP
jgi:hypothetical protein